VAAAGSKADAAAAQGQRGGGDGGSAVAVGVGAAFAAERWCWRTYKKHERKEGAKQECLVGR
jgi:hypothetical protein